MALTFGAPDASVKELFDPEIVRGAEDVLVGRLVRLVDARPEVIA